VLKILFASDPVSALCTIMLQDVESLNDIIKVPNLRWRSQADIQIPGVRATGVQSMGLNLRGKWSIPALTLTSQIQPSTTSQHYTAALSSISYPLRHQN
jgi:hypothetical protein